MGSGWRQATVQEVKNDRLLVLGRRMGSLSKTSFHVFDARNVSTDPRRLCEALQQQAEQQENARQGGLL